MVPYALIQRRLGFRRIGLIETASFLVGTVATLALAIEGFDGEAIVLGLLINSGVATALFLASAPSALPRWRPSAARDVAVFGLPAALASLVHASFRNVDYAIIGARLSAAQLGFYYRAFGFSVNYPNRMTAIMARVSFPVFSRAGEAAEMHALRGRFVRVQAAVIFPFLLLLVATAPVGIPWLLGDRWEPAVVPMQILAFAGLTACLYESIAPLLLATGKVRSLLGFNLVGLILYVVAIYLAAGLGLTAVCLAVVGVHLCLLFGTYFFLVHRLFHLPLRSLWDDMAPASVAGSALLLVAFAAVELLSDAGVATVPILLAAAVAGTLSYLLVMRLLFETVWSDLRTLLRRVVLARKRTPGSEADRVPSLARVPAGAG